MYMLTQKEVAKNQSTVQMSTHTTFMYKLPAITGKKMMVARDDCLMVLAVGPIRESHWYCTSHEYGSIVPSSATGKTFKRK